MRRSTFGPSGPPVGRRRRWTPRDIQGCALWVHGDAGITLSGSSVATWADQSGNGNALSTFVGSPLRVTAGLNGHNTVRFDPSGAGQSLKASFTLSKVCTIIIVYKSITIGGVGANDIIFDGSAIASTILATDTTPRSYLFNGSVLSGVKVADGAFAVVTCVFNGASSVLRSNGTQIVVGNAGSGTDPGGVTLGQLGNGTRGANIEVADLFIYNRAISSSEYIFSEQNMIAKYAL